MILRRPYEDMRIVAKMVFGGIKVFYFYTTNSKPYIGAYNSLHDDTVFVCNFPWSKTLPVGFDPNSKIDVMN